MTEPSYQTEFERVSRLTDQEVVVLFLNHHVLKNFPNSIEVKAVKDVLKDRKIQPDKVYVNMSYIQNDNQFWVVSKMSGKEKNNEHP